MRFAMLKARLEPVVSVAAAPYLASVTLALHTAQETALASFSTPILFRATAISYGLMLQQVEARMQDAELAEEGRAEARALHAEMLELTAAMRAPRTEAEEATFARDSFLDQLRKAGLPL